MSNFVFDQDGVQLTQEELDILSLTAKGFTYKQIGDILGLNQYTVGTARALVNAKLEARNAAEAIYNAFQIGIFKVIDYELPKKSKPKRPKTNRSHTARF